MSVTLRLCVPNRMYDRAHTSSLLFAITPLSAPVDTLLHVLTPSVTGGKRNRLTSAIRFAASVAATDSWGGVVVFLDSDNRYG